MLLILIMTASSLSWLRPVHAKTGGTFCNFFLNCTTLEGFQR